MPKVIKNTATEKMGNIPQQRIIPEEIANVETIKTKAEIIQNKISLMEKIPQGVDKEEILRNISKEILNASETISRIARQKILDGGDDLYSELIIQKDFQNGEATYTDIPSGVSLDICADQKKIIVKTPHTLRRESSNSWYLYRILYQLFRDTYIKHPEMKFLLNEKFKITFARHFSKYTPLVSDNDNFESHRLTNLICMAMGCSDAIIRMNFEVIGIEDSENYLEIIVSPYNFS